MASDAPNFGLPPRPPTASTALWARILEPKSRLPTSLAEMPNAIPPPAPLDKNATTMRILLHDTQANLEKFGDHVRKLIEGVKETKHEIKTTNTLFERDRETLVGDITDLINRSQKEIQKAIGCPATNDSVQSFFKDVNGRLTDLDHRISAIQAFNQTHAQALQSQMQAVQILLDKQGSILTAVMPLLPLLQALPLHIDGAKTNICENLTKALSSRVYVTPKTSDMTSYTPEEQESRKRKHPPDATSSSAVSSSSPIPDLQPKSFFHQEHKRMRTDPSNSTPGSMQESAAASPSSAPLTISKLPDAQEPSRRTDSASGISPRGREVPGTGTDKKVTITASATPSANHRTFTLPTFSTPLNRRPLSDLLPPPPSRQDSRPIETPRKNTLCSVPPSSSSSVQQLRVTDSRSRTNTIASTAAATGTKQVNLHHLFAKDTPKAPRTLSLGSEAHLSPRDANLPQRPTEGLEEGSALNGDFSRAPGGTRNAIALPSISLGPGLVLQEKTVTGLPNRNSTLANLPKANRNNVPPILEKERWSPVREGRRFIPLVDSEDEDDENE
ncbi:hypothetical protein BDN70DRAFT_994702 [Pholiota conissans]|uniref:Uncharacterized protein n=1 Tax=Pholiota conissans TaxID=109636 RepID=A0A9P5YYX4_9AGAR|nr:hypothetical protein BDN70DRAFT_994702 [Pholiota conissans]